VITLTEVLNEMAELTGRCNEQMSQKELYRRIEKLHAWQIFARDPKGYAWNIDQCRDYVNDIAHRKTELIPGGKP